jgi:hypothetical protein
MIFRIFIAAGIALSLFACENSVDSDDQQSSGQNVAVAEAFIDAFYSFDPDPLMVAMTSAEESIPSILFYQGWAEGGNYQIVKRKPCRPDQDRTISCSITVKDDLIGALGIGFDVTDTFQRIARIDVHPPENGFALRPRRLGRQYRAQTVSSRS